LFKAICCLSFSILLKPVLGMALEGVISLWEIGGNVTSGIIDVAGIIAGVSASFSISTGSLGVVFIIVVVAVIGSCFING